MPNEIERKYLVDLTRVGTLENGVLMKQGYIPTADNTAVRVRIAGTKAWLTLKGENKGLTRTEFEYEIPQQDAKEMLSQLCKGPSIEKTRYLIRHRHHNWELDIFHGDNEGLVVAEIELNHESEHFEVPTWVTTEVSGDSKYYNSSLLTYPFKQWHSK
ncbi:CYTH domain-containing protein [Agarilytica rhodophyticola]|uniref:CYTH domain-containing protein n=1 Tax=Agarilytica rhodophyticola TaxID=1737490 RepID=UPI000B3430FA|nr:CYTH domain-containing protein [Agarilytica rhodophyticola]